MAKRPATVSKQGLGTVIATLIAIGLQYAPDAPDGAAPAAFAGAGALGVWWAHKHYREGNRTAARKRRFWHVAVIVCALSSFGVWWAWPRALVLMLHDIYGESWQLSKSGDPPANLETASPLRVVMNDFHRIDPCVMPPESVSNVEIALTFPPDIEVRADRRFWQEWPERGNKRVSARFGNLDPNPIDCTVMGSPMPQPDEPPPLQFRAASKEPFRVQYRVTGRVAKTNASLSAQTREIVINPITP